MSLLTQKDTTKDAMPSRRVNAGMEQTVDTTILTKNVSSLHDMVDVLIEKSAKICIQKQKEGKSQQTQVTVIGGQGAFVTTQIKQFAAKDYT